MTSLDCDVAVVGAGPTGLTLANLLGQFGVRVVLVERNQSTVQEPRAVSIDDESLRTMEAIGVVDQVIKDVALDYGSHYFDPDGQCFLRVEPTTREYGFPRRNAFAQPRLEGTLRAALARFANVEALFGRECLAIDEGEDHVSLTLRDSGDMRRTVRARYLVGCDGARSAVRERIGARLAGSSYRQRWLILDLASTKERLRQTRVVCNPDRPLITLPGPNGTRRYEFMLREHENEEAGSPEFARKLLAAHGPDEAAPFVRQQVYAFHARMADRWNTKRIFLAGDAAHLSPPFAGQGMNSGIRDASNIGWKLAAVVQGRLGPDLLQTYQVERAPHAWALIELAMKMGHVMMPTSRVQAWLVRLGFSAAGRIPALQSYFAEMKYKPKPVYDRGFVLPESGRSSTTGRMLPQPRVEFADGSRALLDHALGHAFSLVAAGPDAQSIAAAVAGAEFGLPNLSTVAVLPSGYNADVQLVDAVKSVRVLASPATPTTLFDVNSIMMVRPDRHVLGHAPVSASTTKADVARFAVAVKELGRRTWRSSEVQCQHSSNGMSCSN